MMDITPSRNTTSTPVPSKPPTRGATTSRAAPQGAGGAGGLLSVTEHDKQTPLVSYPCYDGNGNITEYLTEENGGTLAAHYEYDAFGNVTKKTGEREYEYQFSTKPYDALTGLNYYNYRDYDPVNGRWINRDPIEEIGGMNLYNFLYNACNDYFDVGGNYPVQISSPNPSMELPESNNNSKPSSSLIKIARKIIKRKPLGVIIEAASDVIVPSVGGYVDSHEMIIKEKKVTVCYECYKNTGYRVTKSLNMDGDSEPKPPKGFYVFGYVFECTYRRRIGGPADMITSYEYGDPFDRRVGCVWGCSDWSGKEIK